MGQAAVTTLADLPARAAALITPDPLYGCWLWAEAKRDRHGYGTYWTTGGARQAHRFVYETLIGPVPAGLVLDHLCRRRACVRPDHLEPITGAENDRRRSARYRARMTKCRNGHALATCITTPEGGRVCRTCAGPEAEDAAERWASVWMPNDRPFAGIDRGVAPNLLGGKVAGPPPPGALVALIEREARALAAKNDEDREDRDPGDEDVRP